MKTSTALFIACTVVAPAWSLSAAPPLAPRDARARVTIVPARRSVVSPPPGKAAVGAVSPRSADTAPTSIRAGLPPSAKGAPPPATPAPAPPREVQLTVTVPRGTGVEYVNDVAPLLDRAGCASNSCHGASTGQGGLKLSLFGADPEADFDALTRDGGGRRVNLVEPLKSLLLQKMSGATPHTAPQRFAVGSPEYRRMASWISQGAPWMWPDRPRLVELKVAPSDKVLPRNGSRAVRVRAVYANGSVKDVTALASFRSTAAAVAQVTPEGTIVARGYGQCYIIATFMRHSALTRVAVPQRLPIAFPTVRTSSRVDALWIAQLKRLGIPPSPACDDSVFLRRIYLDTTGVLPTPDEARNFLSDSRADRRARLIDNLLGREEFADYWAMKWGDLLRIKSEYPVRLWPKAVQTYHRWVRRSIVENKPYDQFVREMLTSSGSNFRVGPANYYRAVTSRDPMTFGETTALLFMGARLGCARCHGHPYENWTAADLAGMGAFFSGVRFKLTQEWKEEVVYVDPDAVYRLPRTVEIVKPRVLGAPSPLPDDRGDPRDRFAHWLTSPGNPWFARNIANRVWYWLIGRGIVEEPDDLRPTNPPSNAALLDYLADELVRRGYDTRWLYREILNSQAYQLATTTTRWNRDDTAQFSHRLDRRLGAEQLLDAVCQVTETTEQFTSTIPEPYTYLPRDTRAVQIADGSIDTPFLDLFGRPPRDTPYESGRCSRNSLRQSMLLLNSAQIENKVSGSGRLKRLLQSGAKDDQIVEEIYLAALSRYPTAHEKRTALDYVARDPKARSQAIQDVLWAMLNTKEFLFDR